MNITKLEPNEIFVFGSNLAGNHAGGAAKQAKDSFGAVDGVGEGITGQCYAFPTLNADMSKRTIAELEVSRNTFFTYAKANPDKTFKLTKVGCGVAGYTEDEIKPLFYSAPSNVIKPEGWDKRLWKFLRTGMKSEYGNCEWKVGEWKKEEKAETCNSGFHASTKILDALNAIKGEILAEVEVRGESDIKSDKESWTEMRIIKVYPWTKTESVKLAIFSAEQVIDIFEKKYPKDDRPRKAIEAAKNWLDNPSAATNTVTAARAALADAYSARATYAAVAAAYAAARATYAAVAAAYAADAADAADAAAYAAYAAYAAVAAAYAADAADAAATARAADATARAAADAGIKSLIENFIIKMIK